MNRQLLLSLSVLVSITAVSGIALAVVENTSVADGLWMSFTVVSTTGFGSGPATGIGRMVSAVTFMVAAGCWFGVASVAIEVGLARFQRTTLLHQALEPLARRAGPRLFDRN